MTIEAWISVAVLAAILGLLAAGIAATELAMLSGLVVVVIAGAIDLETALAGFAHPAVVAIAALFVVAAGLSETGATQMIAQKVLGRPNSTPAAQARLMVPVAVFSAFMNNTPIVAMYLPIVNDWARTIRVSPSKLFMPLSFAAILGGRLTLIGSSSNLVVMGQYVQFTAANPEIPTLSSSSQFWGPAVAGLPAAVLGVAFILATSKWLLPARKPVAGTELDSRKYTVQMTVRPESPIVGRSVEQAGLRHLPGLFLSEIERGEQLIPAPSPAWIIRAGDTLSFAGILESVVDLRKIRGLVPATNQVEKVRTETNDRTLVEAVVSRNSPLVGRSVKESRFRTTYNAAIIAVHRNGEQIRAKVGDIRLEAGDTLLLETHKGFVDGYRNSDDFYLVSNVPGSAPVRHDRAWVALAVFGAFVVVLAATSLSPATVALSAAVLMTATGCLTAAEARSSVNLQVIIVIACALGLSEALRQTGAAAIAAAGMLDICTSVGMGPAAMLFVIAMLASFFAQMITNNGAAALMFPVAMATAQELNVNTAPFMFTLLLGCGLSFMTPIAYQTNLMVFGPGGYRFLDFARLGAPLTLLIALLAAWIVPLAFPF